MGNDLKYTTGEAAVEIKVLETSPGVSRNHLWVLESLTMDDGDEQC